MITSYIALGSNLQEPLLQLRTAVAAIDKLASSRLRRISAVYRSAPVGPPDQPDYLNAVLQLDTALAALALLDALQAIEQAQGRVRSERWGARCIDLDILLYGRETITSETLLIPHPAMAQRNFVLYPLADIAGANLVLPDGEELGTLIARCPRGSLVETGEQLHV